MKGPRKSRLSFRSRGVRFIASACMVGALLLVGHIAPVPASGDSPQMLSTGGRPRQQYYLYAADVGRTGGASTAQAPAAEHLSPTQSPPSASCRKDPLAGVYHPWRLHVNAPCITVSGTVERVRTEPDHDWHVNLRLPPSSQHLLNTQNRTREHGELVVEIIPMDQSRIPRPTVGEQITVTGAYVLDSDHGWEEIHPAWLVGGAGSVDYGAQAASRSVEIGIRGNESYFGKRR